MGKDWLYAPAPMDPPPCCDAERQRYCNEILQWIRPHLEKIGLIEKINDLDSLSSEPGWGYLIGEKVAEKVQLLLKAENPFNLELTDTQELFQRLEITASPREPPTPISSSTEEQCP